MHPKSGFSYARGAKTHPSFPMYAPPSLTDVPNVSKGAPSRRECQDVLLSHPMIVGSLFHAFFVYGFT